MEGKLVTPVVARLAQRDTLDQMAIHRLQESIGFVEQIIDGLGFCLSEEGDLLSQWRGYAADATGFTLEKVQDDPNAQEAQVEPTYRKVKQFTEAGAFRLPGARGFGTVGVRRSQATYR
jgi:hypothetical protein